MKRAAFQRSDGNATEHSGPTKAADARALGAPEKATREQGKARAQRDNEKVKVQLAVERDDVLRAKEARRKPKPTQGMPTGAGTEEVQFQLWRNWLRMRPRVRVAAEKDQDANIAEEKQK